MMPRSRANAAPNSYRAMAASRTCPPRSAPIRSQTAANEMFWSCAPPAALVEGAKIVDGSRLPSTRPGGSAIPQTMPLRS